jgi:hypothetical protein
MAIFAATNTFVSGGSITASGQNTNWTDLASWLNSKYNGSDTWGFMKVSSSNANPVDITSSASTTELSINNTATDGDPEITFKLSGTATHTVGVDDSDSDFLKFATTGITTNVAMQIPTGGAQVQFANGSAVAPCLSLINSSTTGLYRAGSDDLGITNGGGQTAVFTSDHRLVGADGLVGTPFFGFINDLDTGMWRQASNTISMAAGGVESARFDDSAVATNTRMLIYDVTRATMSRVSIGGSDTGGVGFRLLRVPN